MPRTIDWGLTKDIANGIAITSLIFAVSVYMPFIGLFGIVFLPLPIIFYRLKLGRINAVSIPVAAIAIMVLIIGDISIDLLFFFELLLLGFALGEFMELDFSIEKIMLYTCCAVILFGIFSLFIYSRTVNTGLSEMASAYVAKNLQLIIALYRELEISEADIQIISNSMESIQYVLVRILPALAIASTLIITWTNILLAKPLLMARELKVPYFGSLKTWKAPDIWVWGVIGCGLLMILPVKPLKMIGLNGVIILLPVYFFQGVANVSFYFEKKRFPRLLRFIIYSLVALQQILILVVITIGFFDIWFDFRKLEKKINHQEE